MPPVPPDLLDALRGARLRPARTITIEAAKKVTSAEQQLGAEKSTFESVQASSGDNLPTQIEFHCEAPYFGLSPRTLTLRLSVLAADKPMVVLRVVKLEEHQEGMAAEFAEKVRAELIRRFETDFTEVRGRVNRLENGPPVGFPVQFRVVGPDPQQQAGFAMIKQMDRFLAPLGGWYPSERAADSGTRFRWLGAEAATRILREMWGDVRTA